MNLSALTLDTSSLETVENCIPVMVETPRGSRIKFKFDETSGLFKLGHVLNCGLSFPYDFGFIPHTRGEDGDPLDILLLLETPTFPGCWVPTRLLGHFCAEQKNADGKWIRNDRFLGVAQKDRSQDSVRSYEDVSPELLNEIETFYKIYNQARSREYRALGWEPPELSLKQLRAQSMFLEA